MKPAIRPRAGKRINARSNGKRQAVREQKGWRRSDIVGTEPPAKARPGKVRSLGTPDDICGKSWQSNDKAGFGAGGPNSELEPGATRD